MATADSVYYFVGKPYANAAGEVVNLNAYFSFDDVQLTEVLVHLDEIAQANHLQPTLAGAVSAQAAANTDNGEIEIKKADTFIRRSQRNKNPKPGQSATTPIVDIYPPYVRGATGVYGVYPLVSVWLNTEEEVAAFEKATGIVLTEMMLYTSQTPAMRDPDFQAEWEVQLEEPILIKTKTTPKKKEDGTMGKKVRLESWPEQSA
jgi:hypothetical protein